MKIVGTKLFSSFLFLLVLAVCLIFSLERSRSDDKRNLGEESPNKTQQIKLKNIQNYGYYFSVKLGQPQSKNHFTMMVDTTSSVSWIPDWACQTCLYSNKRTNFYNCTKNNSTCFQDKSKDYELIFPQGSVNGYLGSELVAFDGLPINKSINSSIVFANKISQDFYNIQADGILGLGLKENSMQSDIVEGLYRESLIHSKTFSIYLTNNYLGIDYDSRIIFGGYDPGLMQEEFQFSNIVKGGGSNLWSVEMENIKIGNVSLLSSPKIEAVLSTFFPDIGVPLGEVDKILAILNQQPGIHCRKDSRRANPVCRGGVDGITKFPNITFQGKELNLELPGEAYATYITSAEYNNIEIEDGYHIILGFREFGNTTSQFSGKIILGADFQRYFYTFYDGEQQRIGFARAKGSDIHWFKSAQWASHMVVGVIGFILVSLIVIVVLYCKRLQRINQQNSPEFYKSREYYTQMINL